MNHGKLLAWVVVCWLGSWSIGNAQEDQHVILISLDGFRYDYVERFQPENLSKFIAAGTAAEALIPSFPTKTFPNHYTIATGMRPENHGLVDNSFYDPYKDQVYNIRERSIVEDGFWYGGTPIWVHAEKNGLSTASYFFVGSEAPVQGIRPTHYFNYDGNVPNLTRIAKVFEWLNLPEDERPRLITMYFSDMDDFGHRYGPSNDEEIGKRLEKLDRELGALLEGIKSFDLDINVIIVSDHGMADVPKTQLLNLDDITQGIAARVVNNGALAHLYLENPAEMDKVLQQLNAEEASFQAVKVEDRAFYKNLELYKERMGDILILPELGSYLATSSGMMSYQNRAAMFKTDVFGEHGYSPHYKDMHGIFYAAGPMIQVGLAIPAFDNVHVYPLICMLLGLEVPDYIDGNSEVLRPVLQSK
jgi:predicted AlkP superfamily pyrophosphatase or phosphodiesterase